MLRSGKIQSQTWQFRHVMAEDMGTEGSLQPRERAGATLVARDVQRHFVHAFCHIYHGVQQRCGCLIIGGMRHYDSAAD